MSDDWVPSIAAEYKLIADMWTDVAKIHGFGIRWVVYAETLREEGLPKLAAWAESYGASMKLEAKDMARLIPTIE